MSVSPNTEQALRSAMDRLVSGNARHCDGELTVSNLAREASVSRATANRAAEVVAELHRLRNALPVAGAEGDQRAQTLRERIWHLEASLANAKRSAHAEDGELRRRTALLAQQVQALSLDNHRLREQVAADAKVRELHAERPPRR